MSENKIEFFNYPANNIELSSCSGFYPINKLGMWHSGIHVKIKEKKIIQDKKTITKYPVYSPANGKILAYNITFTKNEKKENYFLIEDEISIPINTGLKTLKFYSLISGFNPYNRYYSYSNSWNTLSDLYTDSDFSEKKLPFGLSFEIDTYIYTPKCCNFFGQEYFKGYTFFLNALNQKVGLIISEEGKENIYKTERPLFLPDVENISNEYILFDRVDCFDEVSLLPGTIIKSYQQINKFEVKFTVSNRNNTINYDKYKNQTGYIISDKDNYYINDFGNISLKENAKFYWRKSNDNEKKIFNTNYKGVILLKTDLKNIEDLITELNEQIAKNNLYLGLSSSNKGDEYKKQEENVKLHDNLKRIKEKLNKFEKVLLIRQADNTNKYNNTRAILVEDYNCKYLFRNTEDLLLFDEQYDYLINSLQNKIKKLYKINYTSFSSYTHTKINNKITGLKIMNKGEDVKDASFTSSLGLFECHPYLFTSDNYSYEFTALSNSLSSLYSEVKITNLDSIPATSTTRGCLVFANKESKNEKGSTENIYSDKPIEIAKSNCKLLNFHEVLKNFEPKKNEKLIWCQIESGYICCKTKDIKLRITLDGHELEPTYNEKKCLLGNYISYNNFLGYSDKGIIDWSVFFTDNLLNVNPETNELTLKTDDKCYLCTNEEEKVYIPNNCLIIKEKNYSNQDFIKINKFLLRISIYRNDNKYINENNETLYGIEITDNNKKAIDNKIIKCNKFLKRIYIYTSYIDIKYDENKNKFLVEKLNNISPNNINVGETKYKDFYNDVILPKILNKEFDAYFTNDSSGGFYNFYVEFTPFDYNISTEYQEMFLIKEKDLSSLKIIDDEKGKIYEKKQNENNKGQIITIYNIIEKKTSTTLGKENDNKNLTIKDIKSSQLSLPFFTFYINSKKYKIENSKIKSRIKNPLKDYLESILTINFNNKKNTMISNTTTCPTDKLVCDLQKLKTELSNYENGKFQTYIDNSNLESNNTGKTNYLYKENCYAKILKNYFYNVMAYHPLERDKTLYTEARNTISELKEFDDKINIDIKNELKNIDEDIKSTYNNKLLNNNSYYFIYPPQFYSKIEECGLGEINPYLNYSFSVDNYMNSQTGKNDGTKIFNAITNPGFVPFLGDGKGIYGYANICTQWFNEWPNKKNGDYHHEGVDFSVGGKDFCDITPIKALIPGTVIYSSGDQGNYEYGKYLIIKADKQYNNKYMYFLLGHISKKMDYVKEGHVSPGQIVAYVGNTGHCIGGGYDMKGNTNTKAREKGYGAHLHLTLLLRSEEDPKEFLKNINAVQGSPANSLWITRQKFGNVNPFNYDEKYYKRKDE